MALPRIGRKKQAESDPAGEYRKRREAMLRRLRKAGVPEALLRDDPLPAGPVRKERAVFQSAAEQAFNAELHLERILRKEETFDTPLQRAARLRALAVEAGRMGRGLEAWADLLARPRAELGSGEEARAAAIRSAPIPLWEGYVRLARHVRRVEARCDRAARLAETRADVKRKKFAPSVKL
ncbi:MAG: hypothetical protein QXO51_07270 [Halobacteria archaeon]